MADKWISVKDELPAPFVSVLICTPYEAPYPTVHEGYLSSDGIWICNFFNDNNSKVTHWQPMPEPPKVGE